MMRGFFKIVVEIRLAVGQTISPPTSWPANKLALIQQPSSAIFADSLVPSACCAAGGPRLETGTQHQQNCTDCHKESAWPVCSEPQEFARRAVAAPACRKSAARNPSR